MKNFNKQIQEQFNKMTSSEKLFRVELTGHQVWDLYLSSFSEENNPMFRDPLSSTHNCNHCKNFIRRYGNIVSLDANYNIVSIFDVEANEEYKASADAMSQAIKSSKIKEVFFETFNELNSLNYEKCKKTNSVFRLGVGRNEKQYTKEEAELYGVVKAGEIRTFNHMCLDLPTIFVDTSGDSVESIMGKYKADKNVFKRAMDEISLDTLKLVKDLIIQGSLLNGTTHLYKIEQIIPLKTEYDKLGAAQKDSWCWVASYKLPFAKFKNELIGVLCSELSEGEELNKACLSWNKRVDPANYMKATAPITKKQIEEAQKFVEENSYVTAFDRRLATIDDIKLSEIKHINAGKGEIKSMSIFDNVKSTKSQHKRNEFEGVEEVSIEKFMNDILPGCTSVEAFLKNSHEGNLVTLTTSNADDSKPIFKWGNNYSWTFNGNLAGKSQIKEAVKTAGGKVDGILRFSIMWADGDGDNSDLDAHCQEPGGHIYFSDKHGSNGGHLDIDIQMPHGKLAVENITYPSLTRMKNGVYKFYVHQFAARGTKGFKAEIEFGGEIFSYEYNKAVSGNVQVGEVTLNNGEFTINHKLPESLGLSASKEIYGLETNQFHKVNLVCLSPNHWEDNNVGNKHYMFMLDGCKTTNKIRSFHTENLASELLKHSKVMEVLGATNMIEPTDKQLSGIGFNSTVHDELIVKLSGNFKRIVKIKI